MINLIKRQIKRALRPALSTAYDNIALQQLRSFAFDYLPWTAAAIRPASLCAVLNEVIINRRRSIVEFGCGISTLYLGTLLKRTGGRMISFEHDQAWRSIVAGELETYDLLPTVELVHAPLAECRHSLRNTRWYDEAVVRQALSGRTFDGVLVDGPPASSRGQETARYPAVPVVREYLESKFFVYLDDVSRAGESEIFARWEELLGIEGQRELVAGQFGLLRQGSRFAVSLSRDG